MVKFRSEKLYTEKVENTEKDKKLLEFSSSLNNQIKIVVIMNT